LSFLAFRLFPYQLLVYLDEVDIFHNTRRIPRELVREYAESLRVPGTLQGLHRLAKALVKQIKAPALLDIEGIAMPTAIIWGNHDKVVPIAAGRRLHAAIRHSEFFVIADAGHAPQEECPMQVAALIGSFLT